MISDATSEPTNTTASSPIGKESKSIPDESEEGVNGEAPEDINCNNSYTSPLTGKTELELIEMLSDMVSLSWHLRSWWFWFKATI